MVDLGQKKVNTCLPFFMRYCESNTFLKTEEPYT